MFGRHAAVFDPDDVLQWNSTLALVVGIPDIQPRCLRSGSRGPSARRVGQPVHTPRRRQATTTRSSCTTCIRRETSGFAVPGASPFTKRNAIRNQPLTVDPAPNETVYVNRFPKPIT